MTAPLLTLTGQVTRGELGLSNLQLEDPGNLRITRLSPGGRQWDRQEVGSRYMHGDALVSAVLRASTVVLGVRCYGTSSTAMENRANELIEAFSQTAYNLQVVIDGVEHFWWCRMADVDVAAGDYDKFALAGHQQEYQLTVPRHPVPVAGAL